MREIKFRAWGKNTGIPYDNVVIEPTGQVSAVLCGDTLDDDLADIVDLEQYTGIRDANNRKIYEGDIVSVSMYGEREYIDEVVWGGADNYPAFDLKHHAYEYESNALSEITNIGAEKLEVIGNIHENPELLEAMP